VDYPKSVPSVGLLDGKFVDENPVTGQVGSLISAEWGNAVTLEILNVLRDASIVPDESDYNQLSFAISKIVKNISATREELASDLSLKADKATTLAGYGIADAMKKGTGGVGEDSLPTVVDLNSIATVGQFRFGPETLNIPSGARFGTVSHACYDQVSGSWTQLVLGADQGRAWFRSNINSSLQPWLELLHSGNFNLSVLVGMVVPFATTIPPDGWLKCNGAAVSRVAYSSLFQKVGVDFGEGDGITTFNLPDLRGEFVRGLDDGRGIDAGRAYSSIQGDAIRNITGDMTNVQSPGYYGWKGTGAFVARDRGGNGVRAYINQSGMLGMQFDASLVVPTANENRPRNISLPYYIKY
jgi:phage-related tail fiber protein